MVTPYPQAVPFPCRERRCDCATIDFLLSFAVEPRSSEKGHIHFFFCQSTYTFFVLFPGTVPFYCRDGRCKFAGIDVSASFLEEAKENLMGFVPDLRAEDIDLVEAEYIAGLQKVRQLHPTENLCILWLGSSVGNLTNDGAAQFFKDMLAAAGQKSQVRRAVLTHVKLRLGFIFTRLHGVILGILLCRPDLMPDALLGQPIVWVEVAT
jgi:hypothetical protein